MIRLLKSEMMKLLKSLPIKILFFLMLGLSVVTSLSSLNYVGSPNAELMEIALYGYDAFFSSLRDTPTIAIIGIIIIGLTVCSDFENRTIPMEIAAGYSRSQVLFSKLIAVSLAHIVVLLPYPLGRAILQGIFIGFGVPISMTIILRMLSVFLVVTVVGIAMNGITILLSFIVRKTIIVVGIGFVLVVLGGNALLSFGVANQNLGTILSKTPLGLIKALAIGNYSTDLLFFSCGVGIICIGVFVLFTHLLFCKTELK